MGVLDDYLVDPRLSLLDKTRIQAQVLVPVLRVLRAELGKEKADAIVRDALRDWSKQLFAAVGESVEGSPRRKWAAMQTALTEITEREVTVEMIRHDKEALEFDPELNESMKKTSILVGKFEAICSLEGFGYRTPSTEELQAMAIGIQEIKELVEKRAEEI